MNKIIVVGHPLSGYKNVEKLLLECGMASALPSHQEKLSPHEIDLLLCKAHGVAPLDITSHEPPPFDQIEIGIVWNGMILDLMRGNLEQQFWGWADPQAIYLLDYLKTIDSKVAFILVYNHPRTAVSKNLFESDSGSTDPQKGGLAYWQAYNDSLLHFFQRNTERCLLVHAEQVRTSVNSYLQQLRNRLDAPIGKLSSDDKLRKDKESDKGEEIKIIAEKEAYSQSQTDMMVLSEKNDHLELFLTNEVVRQFPEAIDLYEELQAIATLPYNEIHSSSNSPFLAWQDFSRLQQENKKLSEQSQKLKSEHEALQLEKIAIFQQKMEEQQENELLIQQLFQAQEELEGYYLEKQEDLRKIQELQLVEKKLAEQDLNLAQQNKMIQDLNSQLHDKELNLKKLEAKKGKNTQELQEENDLLLLQLHQVQEELEEYFLENTKLRNNQQPVYYGAVERVKDELPYQIGAAIIERSRKIWPLLFLPFSMSALSRRYRKAHIQQDRKLPSLSEYRDYPKAQKTMQHLSYRLGTAWLRHCRTPWGLLVMPFALIKADKKFQQDKKQ